MRSGLIRARAHSIVSVMLIAVGLLFVQPQGDDGAMAAVMPQGKGGTIRPVPTPSPSPKKATQKKPTPAPRASTRSNPNAQPREDEAAATERTYWETIRNSTDAEDFRAYLKKYPAGQFADLANNRIRALEAPKPQPSPTPAPAPEIAFDWVKPERDLPAPVRLEWMKERRLSFSVPSGWTRTQREEGTYYLQLSFRAPDSPQTNISVQLYMNGVPHTLRNNAAEVFRSDKELVDHRRNQYAAQKVSATLTDTKVIDHLTGRWHTFTADVLDWSAYATTSLVPALDAVYPDDVWQKCPLVDSANCYELNPGSLGPHARTRHSYAILEAGYAILVMLYTAPIEKFDDKMLPSVMATLKMSGTVVVHPASSDSTVNLSKYEPEILIDGEQKAEAYKAYPLNAGKHRVNVRAKEHKPFEKEIHVRGWEKLDLGATLERMPGTTSGAKPK
jgi:hypothetical protein